MSPALACLALMALPEPAIDRPMARFGVIADIQYAAKPTEGARDYAGSLLRLRECVAALNREKLDFVVSLGDIVDGRGDQTAEDIRAVRRELDALDAPIRYVVGNHCLSAGRALYRREMPGRSTRFAFRVRGCEFIGLDALEVSLNGATPANQAEGRRYLAAHPRAQSYNGAVGPGQLEWLGAKLRSARSAGRPAILFCHNPILPAATHPGLLLWDHAEVTDLVERSGAVALWLNGHDHAGGYAEHGGVHYLTAPGMVEAGQSNAFAVIEVYRDRIEVIGSGTFPNRTLAVAPPGPRPSSTPPG